MFRVGGIIMTYTLQIHKTQDMFLYRSIFLQEIDWLLSKLNNNWITKTINALICLIIIWNVYQKTR